MWKRKRTFRGITVMLWELHQFQRGHKNVVLGKGDLVG